MCRWQPAVNFHRCFHEMRVDRHEETFFFIHIKKCLAVGSLMKGKGERE